MLDQIVVIVSVTSLVMVIPGPDMVLVLRNTVLAGRRAGLHTSLGVLTGNLVHVTGGVLGIGWLISQSILAFEVLRYAAAVYLIYLGVASIRSRETTIETGDPVGPHSRMNWFAQGLISNVLNPKGALFYLGVFTMVITPQTPATATLMLIVIMLSVSTTFWLAFIWMLDRAGVRGLFERSRVKLHRMLGGLLIVLGVRLALTDR